MTAETSHTSALKPIDEKWMVRALLYIWKADRRGEPVTWSGVAAHMNWTSKCTRWRRMGKLRSRGVVYVDHEPHSTHLSPEGVAHLQAALKAGRES